MVGRVSPAPGYDTVVLTVEGGRLVGRFGAASGGAYQTHAERDGRGGMAPLGGPGRDGPVLLCGVKPGAEDFHAGAAHAAAGTFPADLPERVTVAQWSVERSPGDAVACAVGLDDRVHLVVDCQGSDLVIALSLPGGGVLGVGSVEAQWEDGSMERYSFRRVDGSLPVTPAWSRSTRSWSRRGAARSRAAEAVPAGTTVLSLASGYDGQVRRNAL